MNIYQGPSMKYTMKGISGYSILEAIILTAVACGVSLLLLSCSIGSNGKTVTLWTDQSDLVVYTEFFNTAQKKYKIEAFYYPNLSLKLAETKTYPDIIIGSGLKNASTRKLFKSLDYFFDELLLRPSSFYTNLLNLGRIDGKQYLLPVSFNIPGVIFSKENAALVTKPFVLTLDEIQELGKTYNATDKSGEFIKMGFSPRWNKEFLFIVSRLFNVSYREGSPLAWDNRALDRAVQYVYRWSVEVNGGPRKEDDFAFKYLIYPPVVLATSGRVLFSNIASNELLTTSEDRLAPLDFRWVSYGSSIPIIEGSPYLGIFKQSTSKPATDAFIQWFYKDETQRQLLQLSKEYRMMDRYFGIANGFSALRTVTEQIFPIFYPSLLGHIPPADQLTPPAILPREWDILKQRIILPYLEEACRTENRALISSLEKRLNDWIKNTQ
ncbi:MAG: ABC transporter substrate-binding protein [Termitinemataceae bacterium]